MRAKRPDCTFRGNFKLPLVELEKLTRSKGTKNITKKQRLKNAFKVFVRFLFIVGLVAVLAALLAKLYVTYRNRRMLSLSNEGYVPK